MKLKTIKLIACDIDGVLVTDTFSPVMRNLLLKRNREYTRELERNVFSRPRREVGEYLVRMFNSEVNAKTGGEMYFEERAKYIQEHGFGPIEGAPEFLELISSLGVRLVCYGGLSEEHICADFKKYMHYFDRYVCTNDFRPGLKEITKDIYGLEFNQALFIDDVNTVAEVAKANNIPFIGTPANFPWGFQRQDMIATGVKYLLDSVKEIDLGLLERIDNEAFAGTIWS
jgi:phosphoglycolate phosphatase-like HAD superfamily hydrolase